jgi:xanthosine utilization system XapX-like protein
MTSFDGREPATNGIVDCVQIARRELSTGFTFVLKFIVPPAILIGYAYAAVQMYRTGDPNAPWFAILGGIGVAIGVGMTVPLKRVVATANGLLVSNYFEEESIPYSAITAVRAWQTSDTPLITVVVSGPYRFGPKIRFTAYQHFWSAFGKDHPVTTFLKSKIAEGRAAIG